VVSATANGCPASDSRVFKNYLVPFCKICQDFWDVVLNWVIFWGFSTVLFLIMKMNVWNLR
jgi:hypothetical protein